MNRGRQCKCPYSIFWHSLQNLTWQALLKWARHYLGSSHRSGTELNSLDNILRSKLLIHCHSLINKINKSDAQEQEASTCSFSTRTPAEVLLHYNESFHLAQQDLLLPSTGLVELIYVQRNFLKFFFPHNSSKWFCSFCLTRNICLICSM